MIIRKGLFHIKAMIKKKMYSLIYGKKILWGKNVTFRAGFSLSIDGDGKVTIDDDCFFNNNCSINCLQSVSIGKGSVFGENVKIYDHNHRFADFSIPIKVQGYSIGKVSIGDHCWIGSNVVILKGSQIEDNCVIGAGCIVNGFVPQGTIVKCNNELVYEKIRQGD